MPLTPATPLEYSQSECNDVVIEFKSRYKLSWIDMEEYIGLYQKAIMARMNRKVNWKLSEQYLIMNYLKPKLKNNE